MSLSTEPFRLLAAASHDLRQLLQTLRLVNASLLRRTRDMDARELLTQEASTIDAMSDLLNTLLNISKLEEGVVEPHASPVEIRTLLRELERQFAPLADARDLHLDVESDVVQIYTDGTLLRELLQNLIANAMRYTDAGGVTLCAKRRGDAVQIEIADTGVGMEASVMAKMYEDFYQGAAHGPQHRGGLGLGLSIVRRLSRLLNIPVQVRSTPGVGTVFTLEAPVYVGGVRTDAHVQRELTPKCQGTILLVEDDEPVRTAIRMYLRLDGHVVLTARSLSELDALLTDESLQADLLITDFRLGGHDWGSTAIQRTRARLGEDVAAVMLTGDTSATPARMVANANVVLLNKPIDPRELTRVVDRLLALRRQAADECASSDVA